MDLTPYVDQLRRELVATAEVGGEEARALAERLTVPLESSLRLALLSALSKAAEEITGQLAPGAVDVRLRGADIGFVVTPPPAPEAPDDRRRRTAAEPAPDVEEDETHRDHAPGPGTAQVPRRARPPPATASRSTPGSSGPSPTPSSPDGTRRRRRRDRRASGPSTPAGPLAPGPAPPLHRPRPTGPGAIPLP